VIRIVLASVFIPIAICACGTPSSSEIPRGPGAEVGQTEVERLARVDSIGSTATAAKLAQLGEALLDPSPKVQIQAAHWLGEVGSASIPKLLAGLNDPRSTVQLAAAYGLGKIGKPVGTRAQAQLTRVLGAVDDSAAGMAAWAIGQIGVSQGRLSAALITYRFTNTTSRYDGLTQIELLGPAAAPAIPFLVSLLGGTDRFAAGRAEAALLAIGPVAIPAIELKVIHGNQTARVAASRILETLHRGF
jgi:HEAT repeat protein